MKKQTGFTLIELIVVIVILGILAATALPKFIDLSGDADKAATQGVAGALGSASTINYSARLLSTANGSVVAKCADVSSAMQDMPAGYAITPTTAIIAGATATCTVTSTKGATATFTAIGS